MAFTKIKRQYKNLKRIREIVNIFIKYGFDYFVQRLGLSGLVSKSEKILKLKPSKINEMPFPVRIRLALEELGPTFVKLGQILSTRHDLIPSEYIKELQKLQDKVPPFPFKQVEQILKVELGDDISSLYNYFATEPYAAASLGQTHLAELKDGKKVIIKVQRPNIEKIIETDLDILFDLARLTEKHIPASRLYDPVGIVEEFSKIIRLEIDYKNEGRNAERFKKNFKDDKNVYAPKIYWDFCSKRILTMEFLEGIKINELNEIDKMGYDRKEIAKNGVNAFMKQILSDGFFHADPHPGNMLVMKDAIIGFVDFGMMGRLNEETKKKCVALLIAILERNSGKIANEILDFETTSQKNTNTSSLKTDIREMLDQYYDESLKEIKLGELIGQLIEISIKYHIKIPTEFSLLGKSLITIEGIGLELDPDFNFAEIAKPYVNELIQKSRNPKQLILKLLNNLIELYDISMLIPGQLSRALKRMESGIFKLEFHHRGLENLMSTLERSTNRISYSLILAAIIIGTSLIMQTDKGPQFMGFPVIGVLGFLISAILGLGLVIMILRSGKM